MPHPLKHDSTDQGLCYPSRGKRREVRADHSRCRSLLHVAHKQASLAQWVIDRCDDDDDDDDNDDDDYCYYYYLAVVNNNNKKKKKKKNYYYY